MFEQVKNGNYDCLQPCSLTEAVQRQFDSNGEFFGMNVCYTHDIGKKVSDIAMRRYMSLHEEHYYYKAGTMYFYVGQRLVNRKDHGSGEKRMYTNFVYEVTEIDARLVTRNISGRKYEVRHIKVEDILTRQEHTVGLLTNEVRLVDVSPNSTSRRPVTPEYLDKANGLTYYFYRTIHQAQGNTYDERPLSLFGFDHYHCNKNDKYTAVSRASRINDVRVCSEFDTRHTIPNKQISDRIELHKQADTKAGRLWDDCYYVTIESVRKAMEAQHWICPRCRDVFDHTDWSIDRIDDALPHHISNCEITHHSCNVKHLNKYTK